MIPKKRKSIAILFGVVCAVAPLAACNKIPEASETPDTVVNTVAAPTKEVPKTSEPDQSTETTKAAPDSLPDDVVPDRDSEPMDKDDVPTPPPVKIEKAPESVPEKPAPKPEEKPAPAPKEAAPGFDNLDIKINKGSGSGRIADYSVGINACETLMESVLIRQESAGNSDHSVDLNVADLNGGSKSRSRTAGRASSPSPQNYGYLKDQNLKLTLDVQLRNQYNVCTTFFHEALHTLSVPHVGNGLMAPVISQEPHIDMAIASSLQKIGYTFIPPVQQRLQGGGKITVGELVDTYTETTRAELLSQKV